MPDCRRAGHVPRQSQQPGLHLEANRAFNHRIAATHFHFPLLKSQSITGVGGGINHQFTLKDAIDESGWKSCGEELAQRKRHDHVGFLAFETHDLVRNGRPKHRQPSGLDGDAMAPQQVGERAGSQEVQFDFVVLVRTRHARRRPQFASETVGTELGPGAVKTLHGP
jgi:hypothetical protein